MYKQVLVVRKDLKMGIGKIAAHCAHASLDVALLADEKVMVEWRKEGAKKIVVKVNSLKEIQDLQKKLKKEKIVHSLIKDAGLTQLKRGTVTVLGIGPEKEKKIDKITGKLKLY
jgi:peptidyl-tRNA hydrolase, PTH2 family